MADRRAFFLLAITGACSLLANDNVAWGPANNNLCIGLRLEKTLANGAVLIYVQNTGRAPRDLYINDGPVQRWLFTAIAPNGKRIKIQDRLFYLSCGLCARQPLTERLAPGATRKWTYAFDRQFYIPPSGPTTTLGKLSEQDYALQVSLEVTADQLKTSHLSPGSPWLGHVDSPAVAIR